MKYKLIASCIIVFLMIVILALKGCANNQQFDAEGNPMPSEVQVIQ